jgi:hypothetical protein
VSESERIQVTKTVDASPESMFAVLSAPSRHPEFDDAGMVKRCVDESDQVSGVGAQFTMDMNNEILGDYQMRNTVTRYEENRAIGWAPMLHPEGGYKDKLGDMKPGGHIYTWELSPAGDGQTTVTQTYDWSKVGDAEFKKLFPLISEQQLTASIDRVADVAK